MDKTKLLPIGVFSKLSGANIKSLRYYDQIGVLPPAYVDPDTGYRYYAFSQIHVVDAIQLCLELDIPLKQFPQFLDRERKQIHYAKLLAKGRDLPRKKSAPSRIGWTFWTRPRRTCSGVVSCSNPRRTTFSSCRKKPAWFFPMKGCRTPPTFTGRWGSCTG